MKGWLKRGAIQSEVITKYKKSIWKGFEGN
jgi:hypothetical protein